MTSAAMSEHSLVRRCWLDGDLSYLLHEGQVELRAQWRDSWSLGRLFVVCCARRWGKSFWLAEEGVEQCLRAPNQMVRLGAPTQKMAKTVHRPHMKKILADCPPDLAPKFNSTENVWIFPNGSEFHLVGCDNGGHERLRGTDTHLGLLDEAGFTDELRYIVRSILMPQTMTVDGRILIASTPSKTPAHDFTGLYEEARAGGRSIHRTIYDAPHITDAQVEEYMAESGGEDTSDWHREYLAEFVVDDDLAVVPEFSRNEEAMIILGGTPANDNGTPWGQERPRYFDSYVSMDVGFHDLTVAAFAYYDFKAAQIVVEDEVVMKRSRSADIDAACAVKERELWGEQVPYLRVVDAPPITVAELNADGRPWSQSRKDDKDAALNALRLTIPNGLRIHERCHTIRAHMRHGIWNRSRTKFERSDAFGHFDGIDAMVYLVRNVNRNRNPYPALPDGVTENDHWISPELREARDAESNALREIFAKKKRR